MKEQEKMVKAIHDYIETLESILENKQYILLDCDQEAIESELTELRRLVRSHFKHSGNILGHITKGGLVMGSKRKQTVCPECKESYIAVYETEDEYGELLKIEGKCQKCSHVWLIAVKEMFR